MKRVIATITKWIWRSALLGICLVVLLQTAAENTPLPDEYLDSYPASRIITDSHGNTLIRKISTEDTRHRPIPLSRMSRYLILATIAAEDNRFHDHRGIDTLAVCRAMAQNTSSRRVVSGASTLTMQLCRMAEDRPRTFKSKLIESFHALQLEHVYSKHDILEMYLNRAPYGGNILGVEAASLAYFAKHASELSPSEAILLAGLPQSPHRFRPDRHLDRALIRRAIVLDRMESLGMITSQQRSVIESQKIIIRSVKPPPPVAPHAAQLAMMRRPSGGRTTIDPALQKHLNRLVDLHRHNIPEGAQIGVVMIDIEKSCLAAMTGSVDFNDPTEGQVNGATALRSPGSTLKTFIYAAAFENKRLAPDSYVYDIPIERGGWRPDNFDKTFSGRITVTKALRQSLNVPAILVAETTGLNRCTGLITSAGIVLPPDVNRRGGLALATGGIEITLLDLTNGYATIGRGGLQGNVRMFVDDSDIRTRAISSRTCAALDNILSCEEDTCQGGVWYMAKTGTSSGRRDGLAVGHNRRYAVGVWVGHFSGKGNEAFIGSIVALPLLEEIFSLPQTMTTTATASAVEWEVTNPLPPPPEETGKFRITYPSNGDRFFAIDGKAKISPKADGDDGGRWFLNGRLLATGTGETLHLKSGGYELRCVMPDGLTDVVRFDVVDSGQLR